MNQNRINMKCANITFKFNIQPIPNKDKDENLNNLIHKVFIKQHNRE